MVVNPTYPASTCTRIALDSYPRADPTCFNTGGARRAAGWALLARPAAVRAQLRRRGDPCAGGQQPGGRVLGSEQALTHPDRGLVVQRRRRAPGPHLHVGRHELGRPGQPRPRPGRPVQRRRHHLRRAEHLVGDDRARTPPSPTAAGILRVNPASPGVGGYPLVTVTYAVIRATQDAAALRGLRRSHHVRRGAGPDAGRRPGPAAARLPAAAAEHAVPGSGRGRETPFPRGGPALHEPFADRSSIDPHNGTEPAWSAWAAGDRPAHDPGRQPHAVHHNAVGPGRRSADTGGADGAGALGAGGRRRRRSGRGGGWSPEFAAGVHEFFIFQCPQRARRTHRSGTGRRHDLSTMYLARSRRARITLILPRKEEDEERTRLPDSEGQAPEGVASRRHRRRRGHRWARCRHRDPAIADPATTYVTVGSDTIQDVMNAFAGIDRRRRGRLVGRRQPRRPDSHARHHQPEARLQHDPAQRLG